MGGKRTKRRSAPRRAPSRAGQPASEAPAGWPELASVLVRAPEPEAEPRRTEPGPLEGFVDRNAPEVVGATYWFQPPPEWVEESVTIRFSGHRLDVTGRRAAGDAFTHEAVVDRVSGGGGPVSVTVKVRDINPGTWRVTARAVRRDGRQSIPVYPAAWSWRKWRVSAGEGGPIRTCLAPLVRSPGVLLGSWPALVLVGVVLALVLQAAVAAARQLALGPVLAVSLLIVLAGAVGGKLWYIFLHRADGDRLGWAVQGFVTGVVVAGAPLLLLFGVPVGAYLDVSAPGLMFGLAVGRLGCFFTGCCAGRPSTARWAVWSSNRSVGRRRVPTQPMEALVVALVGLAALAAVLQLGPRHGTWFVAAVAAYTLVRQSLLLVREEPRKSRYGVPLVGGLAALVLAAALVAVSVG